jgi:hypothetical protein
MKYYPHQYIDKKYLKLRLAKFLSYIFTDKIFIKIQYLIKTHKKLNLKNPTTYNEKIQWLKLYYRNAIIKTCVDKYEVRNYVERTINEDILVPLLGIYDNISEIDYSTLPNSFIMKLTNGSSFNYISYDKTENDIFQINRRFKRWLKTDYFCFGREWAYKNIKNRILCEQLLVNNDGTQPEDYQLFCFNGKVAYITVDYDTVVNGTKTNRNKKRNIYDRSWNPVEGTMGNRNDPNRRVEATPILNRMIKYAEKLSIPFPHVRVDFYCVSNKIFFGELTFYHASGYQTINPLELDIQMGSLIDIT